MEKEKKGELLNQLALISDLIENLNADIKSNTIIFEVSKVEFDRILEVIEKKYNRRGQKVKNSFTLSIGKVDVIFNTSNA
jgi:hypothetical protein